jgi:hypothetical protein
MRTTLALTVPALVLACASADCGAQGSGKPSTVSAPAQLTSLAKALSGNWALRVRFEASPVTGNKAIEGAGEESWSAGPGGIDLIEQEHIPSPSGDTFLMGVIWFDKSKNHFAGMECNSDLPSTCDLKGALSDITITWDGKKFQIDELETHDGKRTIWHEYWSNITADSFDQTGDVTQPDGSVVRFMTVHGTRAKSLKTIGADRP